MNKSLKLIPITLLFCLISLGQINSTNSIPQKTIDPNETVMKYEEFLRSETKLHREYTQEYYDMIFELLGALGVIVGAVLTWMNWRSKEDIRKHVNAQFNDRFKELLDEKLKQIDILINNGKEKSEKQFEEIGKIILELTAKSENIGVKGQYKTEEEEAEEDSDVFNLKSKTVLWVDDNPINNESTMKILEQAGVKFYLALDTESAIERLNKQKFDLIISDMAREKNYSAGIDLLKELKQKGIFTPTIIYSSKQSIDKFGHEALALGAIALTSGVTRLLNVAQRVLRVK